MSNEKLKISSSVRCFPCSCCLPIAPAPALHGLRKTFMTPFRPARSIACTPLASGYSSLIKLSMSMAPFFKRSRAGWNRPQREPRMVISSTTSRVRSNSAGPAPWNVDFNTSTPRGRSSSSAPAKPDGEPDASTTTSNSRVRLATDFTVAVSMPQICNIIYVIDHSPSSALTTFWATFSFAKSMSGTRPPLKSNPSHEQHCRRERESA